MTWTNRLRLLGGLLAVLALVAVLTLIFNHRQSQATSVTATVSAETSDIGAAYGGTVTRQYVHVGDTVKSGQRLFTIQSIELQQDLAQGLRISNSPSYDVNTTRGTLTYKAAAPGQITTLEANLGSSLGTGEQLAEISVQGSQYVDARYLLSPRDYERVRQGAKVSILLPDNSSIDGTVSAIRVATDSGQARTQVRVDSKALLDPRLAALTKPGTPVVATVQLRDDGPLAGVDDAAFNFLRQIGLK